LSARPISVNQWALSASGIIRNCGSVSSAWPGQPKPAAFTGRSCRATALTLSAAWSSVAGCCPLAWMHGPCSEGSNRCRKNSPGWFPPEPLDLANSQELLKQISKRGGDLASGGQHILVARRLRAQAGGAVGDAADGGAFQPQLVGG